MQSLSRFEERYLNPPEIYYDEDDNPMSEQEYRRRQRELWDAAQPEYMGEDPNYWRGKNDTEQP